MRIFSKLSSPVMYQDTLVVPFSYLENSVIKHGLDIYRANGSSLEFITRYDQSSWGGQGISGITIKDNALYVLDYELDKIFILDVSNNYNLIGQIAGVPLSATAWTNVNGNRLLVQADDGLKIYDVTNGLLPNLINSIPRYVNAQRRNGLFFGRADPFSSAYPQVILGNLILMEEDYDTKYFMDISDPLNPIVYPSFDIQMSFNTDETTAGRSAYSIAFNEDYLVHLDHPVTPQILRV